MSGRMVAKCGPGHLLGDNLFLPAKGPVRCRACNRRAQAIRLGRQVKSGALQLPGPKRSPFGWSARLEERVEYDANTGCWLWTGRLDKCGYGVVKFGGRNSNGGRDYQAHRVSYHSHRGAIPAGLVVRHRCDTPACVNPEHLELGTQAQNVADRDARGRTWRKLTPGQIEAARSAAIPAAALADQFGVSPSLIYAIRAGVKHRPKSDLIESLLKPADVPAEPERVDA